MSPTPDTRKPSRWPWVWLALVQWLAVNGMVALVLTTDDARKAFDMSAGWYTRPAHVMAGITGSVLLLVLLAIGMPRNRIGRWISAGLCLLAAWAMGSLAAQWLALSPVMALSCLACALCILFMAWQLWRERPRPLW